MRQAYRLEVSRLFYGTPSRESGRIKRGRNYQSEMAAGPMHGVTGGDIIGVTLCFPLHDTALGDHQMDYRIRNFVGENIIVVPSRVRHSRNVFIAGPGQGAHRWAGRRVRSCAIASENRDRRRRRRNQSPRCQPNPIEKQAVCRLLLVNHDRLFRKFALRSLPEFHVSAMATADAALSAILQAGRAQFHVMILNSELPDIQPSEMVHRCRVASPGLPVLLVGPNPLNELTIIRCAAAADDCLTIPCPAKKLLAAVLALFP